MGMPLPATCGSFPSQRLIISYRTQLDADTQGVVITSVEGGGLAAEAGLRAGDLILKVGGQEVRSPADVERALADKSADAVLFQIARDGTKLFVGVRVA